MAVILPWLLIAVPAVAGVLSLLVLALARPPRGQRGLPFAFADRLRSLPRYRSLARRLLLLSIVEVSCLSLALCGASLLVARLIDTGPTQEERSNRDVVLCLDVSGSMISVDQMILDVYIDLAERLSGERIGLVLFDSTAVTIFPLTDDAAFVHEQLRHTRAMLGPEPVPGTNIAQGSSLIGDGLASCVMRFDQRDARRSRTIVFATDNQLAGEPLYSLTAATDLALAEGVMVFGLAPQDNAAAMTGQLRQQVRRTNGTVLTLHPDRAPDTSSIQQAVEAQERLALAARPQRVFRDLTWPGATIGLLGVLGAGICRRLRGRP